VFTACAADTGYRLASDLIVANRWLDQPDAARTARKPPRKIASWNRLARPYGGTIVWAGRGADRSAPANRAVPAAGRINTRMRRTRQQRRRDGRGPLGMLWFPRGRRAVAQPVMASPAPLCDQGVCSRGAGRRVALDAYNGRELWRYEIPVIKRLTTGRTDGTAGNRRSLCCTPQRLRAGQAAPGARKSRRRESGGRISLLDGVAAARWLVPHVNAAGVQAQTPPVPPCPSVRPVVSL